MKAKGQLYAKGAGNVGEEFMMHRESFWDEACRVMFPYCMPADRLKLMILHSVPHVDKKARIGSLA